MFHSELLELCDSHCVVWMCVAIIIDESVAIAVLVCSRARSLALSCVYSCCSELNSITMEIILKEFYCSYALPFSSLNGGVRENGDHFSLLEIFTQLKCVRSEAAMRVKQSFLCKLICARPCLVCVLLHARMRLLGVFFSRVGKVECFFR